MHNGHLLESETYVGGHVEALECGVFRSDIACRFKIVPAAVQTLIDGLDAALQYTITGTLTHCPLNVLQTLNTYHRLLTNHLP